MTMNLRQHRARPNVWAPATGVDIGRCLVTAAVAGLMLARLRRRSMGRLLLAMGGGVLVWWAATGLGRYLAKRVAGSARHANGLDVVAEASAESFPASDPPSWTTTAAAAPASGELESERVSAF